MIEWLIAKICGETVPSDDVIRWMFKVYEWLLRYEGGYQAFRERTLILPTRENFPITAKGGDFLAQQVFGMVKRHAGMEKWSCRLVAQEDDCEPNAVTGAVSGAAGTFSMSWDHDQAEITYAPRLTESPHNLIAVLAHELSHYWLSCAPNDPPAGPSAEEHATDMTAVFLGFGIFMANSVYHHGPRSYGTQGYLGEVPFAFALAIFTELHQQSPKEVRPHLRPNPRAYYDSALRDLKKRWSFQLENLRRIELEE